MEFIYYIVACLGEEMPEETYPRGATFGGGPPHVFTGERRVGISPIKLVEDEEQRVDG
jgi:hypothetical protein